jgi:transcriptional regulator with GAF, ATPase, and Fis domain
MQDTLITSQKEVSRLAQNSKILFNLLPDSLFIIKDNFVIERMNKSAFTLFGGQYGRKCFEVLYGAEGPCDSESCPFTCQNPDHIYGRMSEKKINDNLYVECGYVPFKGYRQDKLVLLILRDISQKKLHEIELENYSQNIEKILKEKIAVLKQNELEREQLYHEVNYLKKETERLVGREKMIGESKSIQALRDMIHQVADSNATILITGESGTGKELVADLIHRHSSRADKRYLKFNCAAVAESLLESDLFGYEKGAFTGASESRKGKFEEADGGTVFLDEIGDISPKMQASLLRVLQTGEVFRLGSNKPLPVDVRIIAATNSDLAEAVKTRKFRSDLYYRLNVINLRQIPLRERKEDIILLATNFLVKYRERFNKEVTFLPDSVVEMLMAYDWPGNIRELESVIQRAVLLSRNGMITPEDLGLKFTDTNVQDKAPLLMSMEKFRNRSLKECILTFESELISQIMKEYGGNVEIANEHLGLSKTTLYEKLKRYGINPKECKKDNSKMA